LIVPFKPIAELKIIYIYIIKVYEPCNRTDPIQKYFMHISFYKGDFFGMKLENKILKNNRVTLLLRKNKKEKFYQRFLKLAISLSWSIFIKLKLDLYFS